MSKKVQTFDPRQQMRRRNYEIFYYREPRGAQVAVHHHDFYEIYCFMGEVAEYWVDGLTYTLRAGDLLLINPMALHRPVLRGGGAYERYVLWIDPTYLDSLSPDGSLSRCFQDHTHLIGGQVSETLSRLVEECYSQDFGAPLCADGIFLQLMVEINRLAGKKRAKRESPALISGVLAYIGENFSSDISLDGLASRFFVNKYYLSHEFKRETGTSIYRFIKLKRLAAARRMLLEGVPPGEVALACGFSEYTAFFKAFREEYGVPPSRIR